MHTFFLQKPRDVLDMLEFQLRELSETPPERSEAIVYRTIHCAVTAWQLCDWLFDEMSDEQKAARSFGNAKLARSRFQNWVKEQCPALAQCRMVADAAKHGQVTRNPDRGIATFRVVATDSASGVETPIWFIGSSEGFRLPAEVIDTARRFWIELLVDMRLHTRSQSGEQMYNEHSDTARVLKVLTGQRR